jgi:hypothetical protein
MNAEQTFVLIGLAMFFTCMILGIIGEVKEETEKNK